MRALLLLSLVLVAFLLVRWFRSEPSSAAQDSAKENQPAEAGVHFLPVAAERAAEAPPASEQRSPAPMTVVPPNQAPAHERSGDDRPAEEQSASTGDPTGEL